MPKYLLLVIIAILSMNGFAKTNNYEIIVESNTAKTLDALTIAAKKQGVDKLPIGNIIEWTALQLLGKPYAIGLLDRKVPEYVYIGLNDTDCMLFIEEVVAVSELIKSNKANLDNLTTQITNLRYHGDIAYCNRNHYFKDWAYVNIEKNIFTDEALQLTDINLPYAANVMSAHIQNSTKANPHSADLGCIKARENVINFQEHLGFIPLKDLAKYLPEIKSGDIIGIIRSPNGHADSVHHLGVAYVHGGVVSMIHASSDANKVIISDTLTGYLARFKNSQGIILLRAK